MDKIHENRMLRIQELVCRLDWRRAERDVADAMDALSGLEGDEIRFLIFSNLDKSTWENSARVLKSIGFPKLVPHIPKILEWFQDANWPGVDIVTGIFVEAGKGLSLPFIEEAVKKAFAEKDEMWIRGLEGLARNIGVEDADFSDPKILRILSEHGY